jgi:hypothetical protein
MHSKQYPRIMTLIAVVRSRGLLSQGVVARLLLALVVSLGTAHIVQAAAPGDLDRTFSGDGRAMVAASSITSATVAIQADGKIVAVGSVFPPTGPPDFALWKGPYRLRG